jgi:predicted DNA-binding transcriptional regulator AlpA
MSAEPHLDLSTSNISNLTQTYLDIHALSAQTGLSTSTIHRLKKQGRIPFFQPAGKGGKVLFSPDVIEQNSSLSVSPKPPEAKLAPQHHRLSGPTPAWMRAENT